MPTICQTVHLNKTYPNPAFVHFENLNSQNDIRIEFKSYVNTCLLHFRNRLQGTGSADDYDLILQSFNNSSNNLLKIIHKLMILNTNDTNFKFSNNENYLLDSLIRAIIMDQAHDFSGNRCTINNHLIVPVCFNPEGQTINCTDSYINSILHELQSSNTEVSSFTDDNDYNPIDDLKYFTQDTGLQGTAKNVFDFKNQTDNPVIQYKTLANMIDPAGCTVEKTDTVTRLIKFNYEIMIFNIGLIFFQGFFRYMRQHHKYLVITTNTRDEFIKNKLYVLNYYDNTSPNLPISWSDLRGGPTGPFTVKGICRYLTTNATSPFGSQPAEIQLSIYMLMKGYGDFGQMFYILCMNDIHIPSMYTNHPGALPDPIFQDNCCLTTIDRFLAYIAIIINCPFILGTPNFALYQLNINTKYVGIPFMDIYNRYIGGGVKIYTFDNFVNRELPIINYAKEGTNYPRPSNDDFRTNFENLFELPVVDAAGRRAEWDIIGLAQIITNEPPKSHKSVASNIWDNVKKKFYLSKKYHLEWVRSRFCMVYVGKRYRLVTIDINGWKELEQRNYRDEFLYEPDYKFPDIIDISKNLNILDIEKLKNYVDDVFDFLLTVQDDNNEKGFNFESIASDEFNRVGILIQDMFNSIHENITINSLYKFYKKFLHLEQLVTKWGEDLLKDEDSQIDIREEATYNKVEKLINNIQTHKDLEMIKQIYTFTNMKNNITLNKHFTAYIDLIYFIKCTHANFNFDGERTNHTREPQVGSTILYHVRYHLLERLYNVTLRLTKPMRPGSLRIWNWRDIPDFRIDAQGRLKNVRGAITIISKNIKSAFDIVKITYSQFISGCKAYKNYIRDGCEDGNLESSYINLIPYIRSGFPIYIGVLYNLFECDVLKLLRYYTVINNLTLETDPTNNDFGARQHYNEISNNNLEQNSKIVNTHVKNLEAHIALFEENLNIGEPDTIALEHLAAIEEMLIEMLRFKTDIDSMILIFKEETLELHSSMVNDGLIQEPQEPQEPQVPLEQQGGIKKKERDEETKYVEDKRYRYGSMQFVSPLAEAVVDSPDLDDNMMPLLQEMEIEKIFAPHTENVMLLKEREPMVVPLSSVQTMNRTGYDLLEKNFDEKRLEDKYYIQEDVFNEYYYKTIYKNEFIKQFILGYFKNTPFMDDFERLYFMKAIDYYNIKNEVGEEIFKARFMESFTNSLERKIYSGDYQPNDNSTFVDMLPVTDITDENINSMTVDYLFNNLEYLYTIRISGQLYEYAETYTNELLSNLNSFIMEFKLESNSIDVICLRFITYKRKHFPVQIPGEGEGGGNN